MVIIYKFSASWCVPCKSLSSMIDSDPDIQREIKNNELKIIDVDVDKIPDMTESEETRFIRSITFRTVPTLVRVGADHKEVSRLTQAPNKQTFLAFIS